MTERLSALFCTGCGRVDVLEPCTGDCDERPVDLVLAKDRDEVQAQVVKIEQHAGMLRQLLVQLISNMPEASAATPSDWAETQQAMRKQARSALQEMEPSEAAEEIDRIAAWRCMTCGWTEAARECLGICVRDRVDFVVAEDYDRVRSQYDEAHRQLEELAAVVRQFVWVTPRLGEAERTWQSLRSHAQAALTR
jgi:hypothetical protein